MLTALIIGLESIKNNKEPPHGHREQLKKPAPMANTVPLPSIMNVSMMMLNTLMLTHVLKPLPTSRCQALVCSSGSKGYCAVKEMLQNGIPGHTLLIESRDLCEVDICGVHSAYTPSRVGGELCGERDADCCLLYTFPVYHVERPSVYDSDDAETIPYNEHIPITVAHIQVFGDMVVIPYLFLFFTHLTSIDMSAMKYIIDVQMSFVNGCSNLTSIDLSPLSKLTEISGSFLQECSSLTSIDLSPLSQVTTIKGAFLKGCSGLKSIDLSPLCHVTDVSTSFLRGCSKLSTINLEPLSNVTIIRRSFLEGCTGLTSINLGPLSRVTKVQASFLKGCTGLKEIDLEPLSNVTEIDTSFLEGCSGLTTINLSFFTQLTQANKFFLKGCSGLETIDMGALFNLMEFPWDLVPQCESANIALVLPTHLRLAQYMKRGGGRRLL